MNNDTNQIQDIQSKLEKLELKISELEQRRVSQLSIIPGAVKNRHVGEGVSYIFSGLSADRPTEGIMPSVGTQIYFETDTNKLYVWNGTAWKSVTLT